MLLPSTANDHFSVAYSTQTPVLKNTAANTTSHLDQVVFLPQLHSASSGMWLNELRLVNLPTGGPAWDAILEAAQQDTSNPDIQDQEDDTDIYILAKGLVYARTGQAHYRQEVVHSLMAAIGTEQGGRTLSLGRNLIGYVIAADLIDLSTSPEEDQLFCTWLAQLLTLELDGRTLQSTHEVRPNNWGTHAGAARAAIAVYLGDEAELARTAQVFKGFLGDRSSYSGFSFGELSWQCDPENPVGVNPAGCTRDGHSIDGVLPDEQRRGGDFEWPPPKEGYVWEGLQGAIVQAQILHRAGYPAWQWEDSALHRALTWLHTQADFPAEGDDEWQPWLVNAAYGTAFPAITPANYGKNMGWTDWTAAEQH